MKIRLDCDGNHSIHPLMEKPWPPKPLEFDVPREATGAGKLTLVWHRQLGLGGGGGGCQVAEILLMKKQIAPYSS
jgi:hypothetical protein